MDGNLTKKKCCSVVLESICYRTRANQLINTTSWIKSITGHNNLAYFQSKLNPEIDPTCRLCLQANETLHHLMTDCEATSSLQLDLMKKQIPLPDMTWSVKDINKFIQHPLIHSLMTYDTQYNNREIEVKYLD